MPQSYTVHIRPRLRRPGNIVFPNWLAITIGSRIWTWRGLDAGELAHELKHVDQWRTYGWTYPFRYWRSSLRAIRRGEDWYRDNEFEREARQAAAEAAMERR